MPLNVTPNGTRGRTLPAPVKKILLWFMRATYRLGARRMDGMPVLRLTTVGAKSGEKRTTPVMAFPEGDTWLIVASFAGAANHPAWFVNMARHPEDVWVEVEDHQVKVAPHSLTGTDRQQAWQRIIAQAPRFADYQKRTDREIPIVRLATAPA